MTLLRLAHRYFPVYSTLFFTDFITDQIRKHPTSAKGDRPLFAYASYQSVHGPLEVRGGLLHDSSLLP